MTERLTNPADIGVGTILRWACRYSAEDLAEFAVLSGRDRLDAPFSSLPDLLVIAPLTKLGGDLNYISRRMTWTAHRAVRPDEQIEAELEVTSLDDSGPKIKIAFDARIRDEAGEVVLSGDSVGIILRGEPK